MYRDKEIDEVLIHYGGMQALPLREIVGLCIEYFEDQIEALTKNGQYLATLASDAAKARDSAEEEKAEILMLLEEFSGHGCSAGPESCRWCRVARYLEKEKNRTASSDPDFCKHPNRTLNGGCPDCLDPSF